LLYLKSIFHKSLKSLYSVISPQHLYHRLFILFLPFALSLALLVSAASAATVTLAWNSNTEPHLEGYVIYRNTGSPGPPYEYSDWLPEDELDDPLNPKVTITGLNEGLKYYFATAAYGTEGNESDFSNEVCVQVSEGSVGVCSESVNPGSGSKSGSSGGGGGCFISSAAYGSSPNPRGKILQVSGIHTLTIILVLLIIRLSCCASFRIKLTRPSI